MSYAGLIAGFAILLVSGDLLVRAASALAARLGIPVLIVGLTVVAFGTSAPEIFVSLQAALRDAPGIALGNVVGSNIANIFLVLGVSGLARAIGCDQPGIARNACYATGATLLFIAMCCFGPLRLWHGVVLFGLLLLFLLKSALDNRKARHTDMGSETNAQEGGAGILDTLSDKPVLLASALVLSLVGLPLGGAVIIDCATAIAHDFGVSKATIGLTIIALGTSLPELATSFFAALRGHSGIVLGNILGSNLFNILAVAGLVAMIVPIPIPPVMLHRDLWIMLAATLAVLPFCLKRITISRPFAVLFTLAYIVYVIFVLMSDHGGMAP